MVVLLMGPAGAGKTTVGILLARQLDWEFADADHFHPPANIEKMRRGIPLDDAARLPWLAAIRSKITQWVAEPRDVVLACSALKRSYREKLCARPEVKLVYLKGTYEVISRRLRLRHGHFAGPHLLASQFATLEEPEKAIVMDVNHSPEEIVAEIRRRLHLR